MPTRFKYRKVKPETYGLTAAEILLADDADLNAHVSIKKLGSFRPPDVADRDAKKASKSKRLRRFRDSLKSRLVQDESIDADEVVEWLERETRMPWREHATHNKAVLEKKAKKRTADEATSEQSRKRVKVDGTNQAKKPKAQGQKANVSASSASSSMQGQPKKKENESTSSKANQANQANKSKAIKASAPSKQPKKQDGGETKRAPWMRPVVPGVDAERLAAYKKPKLPGAARRDYQ